jgi:hypothetical protein
MRSGEGKVPYTDLGTEGSEPQTLKNDHTKIPIGDSGNLPVACPCQIHM